MFCIHFHYCSHFWKLTRRKKKLVKIQWLMLVRGRVCGCPFNRNKSNEIINSWSNTNKQQNLFIADLNLTPSIIYYLRSYHHRYVFEGFLKHWTYLYVRANSCYWNMKTLNTSQLFFVEVKNLLFLPEQGSGLRLNSFCTVTLHCIIRIH